MYDSPERKDVGSMHKRTEGQKRMLEKQKRAHMPTLAEDAQHENKNNTKEMK